jgi:hypothetical protein
MRTRVAVSVMRPVILSRSRRKVVNSAVGSGWGLYQTPNRAPSIRVVFGARPQPQTLRVSASQPHTPAHADPKPGCQHALAGPLTHVDVRSRRYVSTTIFPPALFSSRQRWAATISSR